MSPGSHSLGRDPSRPSRREALEGVLARLPRSGSAGEVLVEVERLLADPVWLYESRTLPDEHPWRAHGRLARDLLDRVVERALDENDREALRGIPRRSPVAAWSLAIRMLDAAYAGRIEDALAIAERMPKVSPAAAITDVLGSVLRGDDRVEGREAGRLYDKLVPLPAMCRKRTREINEALIAGRKDLAYAAARALHARLRAAAPGTMGELRAVLAQELAAHEADPMELAEFLRGFGDPKAAYQQMALVYEGTSPEIASYGWFEYLVHRRSEPIPEPERVAVMRRLFTLVAPHEFADQVVPEQLLPGLRANRPAPHLARLPMRRALQECLLEANPTPETFRVLLQHAREDSERERLARSWCEARPEDSEPHFLLASLLKSRAPRKALAELEVAESLGHDKLRVDRLRLELSVAAAEEQVRRGRGARAMEDLQRVGRLDPRQPLAWRAHVATLTWFAHVVEGKDGKAARAWVELSRLCGDPCMATLWASAYPGWLEGSATERALSALPELEIDGASLLRAVVAGCEWAERLGRPFDPWGLDPEALLEAYLEHGSGLEPAESATLVAHAERALREDPTETWASFAFHLTARGLRGEERNLARFLALRALWLEEVAERSDLARDCDLVAAWYAERWGDRDLLQAIRERSFEGEWPEELLARVRGHAAKVLERERGRTGEPDEGESSLVPLARRAFVPEDLANPFEVLGRDELVERVRPYAESLLRGVEPETLRALSQAFVEDGLHVPSLERLRELATEALEREERKRTSFVLEARGRERYASERKARRES